MRKVAHPQSLAGSSVTSRTASYQPSLFASENFLGCTSFTKRDQGWDRHEGDALGARGPWSSMTQGLMPVMGQGPEVGEGTAGDAAGLPGDGALEAAAAPSGATDFAARAPHGSEAAASARNIVRKARPITSARL